MATVCLNSLCAHFVDIFHSPRVAPHVQRHVQALPAQAWALPLVHCSVRTDKLGPSKLSSLFHPPTKELPC
jgi:hypothetical protein